MGVDAVVHLKFVATPDRATIKRLQYDLMHRFGSEMFWCNEKHGAPPTKDFIVPSDIDGLHEVKIWGRYYRPDYERGDGLKIAGMLLYLCQNVAADVYYCGDSSEYPGEQFNQDSATALLEHYLVNGRLPYQTYGSTFIRTAAPGPICDFCEIEMNRCGFGPNYASFSCLGCDSRKEFRGECAAQYN